VTPRVRWVSSVWSSGLVGKRRHSSSGGMPWEFPRGNSSRSPHASGHWNSRCGHEGISFHVASPRGTPVAALLIRAENGSPSWGSVACRWDRRARRSRPEAIPCPALCRPRLRLRRGSESTSARSRARSTRCRCPPPRRSRIVARPVRAGCCAPASSLRGLDVATIVHLQRRLAPPGGKSVSLRTPRDRARAAGGPAAPHGLRARRLRARLRRRSPRSHGRRATRGHPGRARRFRTGADARRAPGCRSAKSFGCDQLLVAPGTWLVPRRRVGAGLPTRGRLCRRYDTPSSSARSARSFGRPAARLLASSSILPMHGTASPSMSS